MNSLLKNLYARFLCLPHNAEFESVLGFRQLPSVRVASGVSDLHILCRLRTEQSPSPSPSPSQATKTPEGGTGISGGGGAEPPALQPCPVEIAEARWASLRAVADELHRARTQPASEKIVCPVNVIVNSCCSHLHSSTCIHSSWRGNTIDSNRLLPSYSLFTTSTTRIYCTRTHTRKSNYVLLRGLCLRFSDKTLMPLCWFSFRRSRRCFWRSFGRASRRASKRSSGNRAMFPLWCPAEWYLPPSSWAHKFRAGNNVWLIDAFQGYIILIFFQLHISYLIVLVFILS